MHAAELRYDQDYPGIRYSARPVANEIARLQEKLNRGEVRLEHAAPRGYLDSLLRVLKIDPSSQVLVYSKTSLQFPLIRAATPRAIYFNDDTYVAWVQNSDLLEIATMDADRGAVFYTLLNLPDRRQDFEHETSRCLSCHDTFSMSGGGVPRFLFLSAPVNADGILPPQHISIETDDRTPVGKRWGGWYVTGHPGNEAHLGNTVAKREGDLATLKGLFDTRPYPTEESDVVALLVLEHQLYIKNLITRLNFKSRAFLAREGKARWEDTSAVVRASIRRMMDDLLAAMLFARAAPLAGPVKGSADFEQQFVQRGPRDRLGRSLRDFDLQTRLFRYPLSYVIYSEGFDALPDSIRPYLYSRLAEGLSRTDAAFPFDHLSAPDRRAILEILTATKPELARTSSARKGNPP